MEDIIKAVREIKTVDELKELNHIVVDRINQFRQREADNAKLDFMTGDMVQLRKEDLRGKSDRLYDKVGELVKMNPSKAKVKFDVGIWNISYNMLIKEGV